MKNNNPKDCIFLSAGIPDQPDRGPYVESSDPIAIRDAVRALTGTALKHGYTLVFGGHPAISPLVWQIADGLDRLSKVVIYQSRLFEDRIPLEAKRIHNLRWTKAKSDRDESLHWMRYEMLGSHNYAAAVFIGGMDGVEMEHRMFCERYPGLPAYPLGSTGGAAKILLERSLDMSPPLRGCLDSDYRYQSVFRNLFVGV